MVCFVADAAWTFQTEPVNRSWCLAWIPLHQLDVASGAAGNRAHPFAVLFELGAQLLVGSVVVEIALLAEQVASAE